MVNAVRDFCQDYQKVCKIISSCPPLADAEKLYLCIMCAEDKYFLDHYGVSIKSIIRAIIKKHGGASTIEMQLVRIITDHREVTINRKTKEILLAFMISLKFSKKKIIDCYLQNSYYGHNLNSIHDVLCKLFNNHKLSDLSLKEICFIAALIKRPLNPSHSIEWERKINKRINHILNIFRVNETSLSKKMKQMILKDNK